MKEKDWIVATINNPDFNFSQFKEAGLTLDNTQLLSKDKYKESQFIQDTFSDKTTGKFDEASFDKFYENASKAYNAFITNSYNDKLLDNYKYTVDDPRKPSKSDTFEFGFEIADTFNPDRLQTGISRTNVTDDRRYTASELAQNRWIYDYDKQEFRNYSPNDNTLFGNAIGFFKSIAEPLVLAQYDEDGTHVDNFTGRIVEHKKGDLKYDESGTYYIETLSGRSPYGKRIKSIFDSITKDTDKINKYDFLDSDGLDKSVTGSVMKAILTIAPTFIPYVGEAYAAALIGSNLADIIPTLYNSSFGEKEGTRTTNTLQGIARSFNSSVSEYSQNNIVSTENFCKLITDVALQLAEQQLVYKGASKLLQGNDISKILNTETDKLVSQIKGKNLIPEMPDNILNSVIKNIKLRSLQPLMENKQRWAANVSLGYMALVSGANTFETALEAGATKAEAAALSWGTIAGLYAVDRIGIGEWMFDELTPDAKMIQNTAKQLADQAGKIYRTSEKNIPTKPFLYRLFDKTRKAGNSFWTAMKTHSMSAAQKALGEGLEEVSEEAVSDFLKGTFNLSAELGFTESLYSKLGWETSDARFDITSDMLERYATSFFGGMIGGSIYQMKDVLLNGRKPNKNTTQDLIYIIQNGKEREFLDAVNKLEKSGKLGNTTLGIEFIQNSDGTISYTSVDKTSNSQNAAVAKVIRNQFNSIKNILGEENLNLSEDELLKKTIARELKMNWLVANKDYYVSNLLNDFETITNEIVNLRQTTDKSKLTDEQLRNLQKQNIDPDLEINQQLDALRKRSDDILSGKLNRYYTGEAIAAMSGILNPFIDITFKNYAEFITKKSFDSISSDKLNHLKEDFQRYKQSQQKQDLRDAYNMFLQFNEKFSPLIQNNGEIYKKFEETRSKFYNLINYNKAVNLDQNNLEEKRDLSPELSVNISEVANFVNENKDFLNSDLKEEILNIISKINPTDNEEIYKELAEVYGESVENFIQGTLNNPDFDLETFIEELKESEYYKNNKNNPNFDESFTETITQDVTTGRAIQNIKNTLNSISPEVNPLYNLLQQISVNMYGDKLNIFELLKDEENKLKTITNISDYLISDISQDSIENAVNVLQMANSVITAAQNFDSNMLFADTKGLQISGLNNTLNSIKDGKGLLGEISADMGEVMKKDLNILLGKLNYLNLLSLQNITNQLIAHVGTEEKINSIIVANLTDSNDSLSQLNYNGHKLIDDIELTDNNISNATKLLDSIYDNFQEILKENPTKSKQEILEVIFKDVAQQFSKEELYKQKTSKLNKTTQALTDYDLFNIILSAIAFKQSDFNYYLKTLLDSGKYPFAPFYAQSLNAKLMLSIYTDSQVMNFGIKTLESINPDDNTIAALYNTGFINGIGGAGKTAIASLVNEIIHLMDNNATIWKVAPGKTQLENLNENLSKDGKEFTIDEFISFITDPKFVNDINSRNNTSEYYKLETFKNNGSDVNMYSTTNDKNRYRNTDSPKVVFIDEATFVNTLYAEAISNWAQINGVTIVMIGDLNQNSINFPIDGTNVYNIDTGDVYMIRSPKLDISMRVMNIQKKENEDATNVIGNIIDQGYEEVQQNPLSESNATEKVKIACDTTKMHYYEDEHDLNGEKLTDSVTEDEINKLLSAGKVNYVYDDTDSDTYKLVSKMRSEGKDIAIFTPEEVQGREGDYFIIDVSFNSPTDLIGYNIAHKAFYTLRSRSKKGTIFIDKNVSSFIKKENWIKDKRTVSTPDRSKTIEEFKNYKQLQLADLLKDYQLSSTNKSEPPKPNPKPSKPSTDNTFIDEVLADNAANEPEIGIENVRVYNFYMRSGLKKNGKYFTKIDNSDLNLFLNRNEELKDITDADKAKTINDIKEDGDKQKLFKLIKLYNQITGETLSTAQNAENIKSNTLSKISSKFKTLGELVDFVSNNFSEAEINEAKVKLREIKTAIANDNVTPDFINYCKSKYNIDLSNGKFRVKVTRFDESIDYPIDKLNEDLTKLKNDKVIVSLEYITEDNKSITVGVLSRPDTWEEYAKKTNNQDLINKVSKYKNWWNNKLDLINSGKAVVDYTNVDSNNINYFKLTRLVNINEERELKNYDAENPGVIHSDIYIYAGNGDKFREDSDKILNLSNKLRGRAVMFVCSDPNAVVNGEKVDSSNIARLYFKQKELSKQNPNIQKPIRFIVLNPKGLSVSQYLDLSDQGWSKDELKNYVTTIGNSTTCTKMLVSLWNWRANLIHFLNKIDTFKSSTPNIDLNTESGRAAFNSWLKGQDSWANGFKSFQLMVKDTVNENSAPGINPVKTGDKVKLGNKEVDLIETAITENIANAQLKILDKLFEVFGEIIDLRNLNKENIINIKNNGYANFHERLLNEDGTSITMKDENNNIQTIPAFRFDNVYKITFILSNLYKYIDPFAKGASLIKTTNYDKEEFEISIKEIAGELRTELDQILGESPSKLNSTFKNLLFMCLEGSISPGQLKRTWAPFRSGIKYSPVYDKQDDSRDLEDFYPAKNVMEQFTYHTAVELPTIDINLDFVNDTPKPIPQTRIIDYNNAMSKLNDLKSSIEVDDLLADLEQEWNTVGDSGLDFEIDSIATKINMRLSDMIPNKKLLINNGNFNDYFIEAKVDNNLNFTGTTLLEKASKAVNGESLLTDGNLDYSKIEKITENSSNLEKFEVTLKDGTTLNVKYENSVVSVERVRNTTRKVFNSVAFNRELDGFLKDPNLKVGEYPEWARQGLNVLIELANTNGVSISEEDLNNIVDEFSNGLNENPPSDDNDILYSCNEALFNLLQHFDDSEYNCELN